MKGLKSLFPGSRRILAAAGAGAGGLVASTAAASPLDSAAFSTLGWSGWWLPSNHSVHGESIDTLFLWIFWITTIVFIGVQVALVWFLIKYRAGARKKAIFTHGHTRLEMAWTIAPAIILAALAIGSKSVWDEYRYGDPDGPEPARVMVIGEQFQWNIIYPGPDNQLGRYLAYPRPTDLRWPAPPGQETTFADVPGPAYLPREQAIVAINTYISERNRLGKDLTDPAGMDDNWQDALARELVVPVNRPLEVHLSSKDVIHSFFLPNFRVKLDAVPGMRGIVRFTATQTSAEREAASRRVYTTEELRRLVQSQKFTAVVTEEDEVRGAEHHRPRRGPAFWRYADAEGQTIVRHGLPLTPDNVEQLQQAGVQEIVAHLPGYFDLVCAELCGLGHSGMQGRLVVVEQEEYDRRFMGRE